MPLPPPKRTHEARSEDPGEMAVESPDSHDLALAFLALLEDAKEHSRQEVLAALIPSVCQPSATSPESKADYVRAKLSERGLVRSTRRGFYQITESGKQFLSTAAAQTVTGTTGRAEPVDESQAARSASVSTPDEPLVTLADFSDRNQRSIAVISVFVALAVFSNALQSSVLAPLLSFGFLGVALLLIAELVMRFPPLFLSSARLILFRYLVFACTLILIIYWLTTYAASSTAATTIALLVAISLASVDMFDDLRLHARLRQLIDPSRSRRRATIYAVTVTGIHVLGGAIALVASLLLTPQVHDSLLKLRDLIR